MTQPVTVRYQGLQRTQRDHRFDMERNHKDNLAYEVIYNYTYISKNIGFAFWLLLSFQKHQYKPFANWITMQILLSMTAYRLSDAASLRIPGSFRVNFLEPWLRCERINTVFNSMPFMEGFYSRVSLEFGTGQGNYCILYQH